MKYLILGAGPAGLTMAHMLKRKNKSFLVIEKEKEAGGLCRSRTVNGYPLDIGGGHFLDTRNQTVTDFLFEFIPKEEWNIFERDSRIFVNGQYVSHPLEANIWQFPKEIQEEYLESIKNAGCNKGEPMPQLFVDWIYWKLGEKIAKDYMIPYNRKIFAEDLNKLGTYWLEKLPNVSYEETLKSCKEKKAFGKQPGHATFYYPAKFGYGELWLRMAEEIKEHILYEKEVKMLDMTMKTITTADGEQYQGDIIINTIPWNSFRIDDLSAEVLQGAIDQLKHNSVEIRYFDDTRENKAQWIYYPQEELPYHRCLLRNNFVPGAGGYWTETRQERTKDFKEEGNYKYLNEYAYPLNTIGKEEAIEKILKYSAAKGIYGLGRWGEHRHYNSDVVVERALKMGKML